MHDFLGEYSIEIIIVAITCLIISLLYLYQKHQTKTLLKNKENIFNISSRLVDHPIIIFSDRHQVICANEQIQKFIKAKRGDSIEEIAKLPVFFIEREEKSLIDLLDMYQEKSVDNILYMTNVRIKSQEEERSVTLRLSGSDGEKGNTYIGVAIFDATEHLELSKIHYQNMTTGLPNHNKAMADIGLMAHRYSPSNKRFAVAVISVDNFLEIISIVGYKESLQVVSLIARYLQAVSVKNDLKLYHVTSNNFLLILPNVQTIQESNLLVEKYKTDCEALLHSNNAQLHYTISSGISIYPDNGIENLVNSAYKALLLAKRQGLGYTMIAQADQQNTETEAPVKYSEIKRALERGEFALYYQPIYNTEKEAILSAEALIRWMHPTKGIIPPGLFLPLVEKTGFMKHLGEYVSKEAIEQLAIWKKLGFREIQVSINLSLREFETMDYPLILDTLLHNNRINTSQLKVEVTENIAMVNEKYSATQFAKLKKLGIGISLDDFGTGYSSFSMLEAFPIETLKIDRSFVGDMPRNKDHHTIVKAMIAMAHSLGIKVIAEGIEDQKTAEMLEALKCDYMQGYYFGRPMPVFEFQELIRSDNQVSNFDDIIALES